MVTTAQRQTIVGTFDPISATASAGRRARITETQFAIAATAAIGALLAVLIARHAPWRDELQAWSIARDTNSFAALFGQLRYEGHPALWYLVLWIPAHLFRSVVALQVIQWCVATAAVFLLCWRAPFGRPTRFLIAGSYLALFEYGVVARSYGLMWLAILVAVCVLPARHGLRWCALALALAANTTVLAIPLVVGLSVGIAVDRRLLDACSLPVSRRARVGSVALVGLGALCALLTARPAADAAHGALIATTDRNRAIVDAALPLRALVPMPGELPAFWETHVFDRIGMIGVVASCLLVGVGVWFFRRRPAAWLTWSCTALGVPTLLYTRGLTASLRFAGLVFVAAIVALWCMRLATPLDRRPAHVATALGAVGCLATVLVVPAALATPFSGAAATATWITRNAPALPIVCDTAARCSSVGIRLDQPTYAPDQPDVFRYVRFTNAASGDALAISQARALADTRATPVVLLTTDRPADARTASRSDTRIDVRTHIADSVVRDERYWISIVTPSR